MIAYFSAKYKNKKQKLLCFTSLQYKKYHSFIHTNYLLDIVYKKW